MNSLLTDQAKLLKVKAKKLCSKTAGLISQKLIYPAKCVVRSMRIEIVTLSN